MQETDQEFMKQALDLARKAGQMGEVPVGALIVLDSKVISASYNRRETDQSALSHAEVSAISEANSVLGRWRLSDCTLYTSLEPCVMCAGAIQQARLGRLVFGASDPKAGAVESLFQLLNDPRLNHQCEVLGGILADESSKLLKNFFSQLRKK